MPWPSWSVDGTMCPNFPTIRRSTPSEVVVGGGFLWNLSRRPAVFGNDNAGLGEGSPRNIGVFGFALAL